MTSDSPLSALLARLGLDLPSEVVQTALTHDSYANEAGGESNERLEFLGDAVLDLAVADILYRRYPERDEGDLSKLRAVVVSRPVLAEVAEEIGLGRSLLLGKGAEESGSRSRPSVLAAALEAVVGVAFLGHGYPAARALAEELLGARIAAHGEERAPDYKSLLQELGQARSGELPRYEVVSAEGPEHKKVFAVRASLFTDEAVGRGRSKKEAEQAAAKRLYVKLASASTD
jgi:ribonuclease-3